MKFARYKSIRGLDNGVIQYKEDPALKSRIFLLCPTTTARALRSPPQSLQK
jgi:hypothetical protein